MAFVSCWLGDKWGWGNAFERERHSTRRELTVRSDYQQPTTRRWATWGSGRWKLVLRPRLGFEEQEITPRGSQAVDEHSIYFSIKSQ